VRRRHPGELADVLSGRAVGRTHEDEIFVFDTTAIAIAKLAAANAFFDLAEAIQRRHIFDSRSDP